MPFDPWTLYALMVLESMNLCSVWKLPVQPFNALGPAKAQAFSVPAAFTWRATSSSPLPLRMRAG